MKQSATIASSPRAAWRNPALGFVCSLGRRIRHGELVVETPGGEVLAFGRDDGARTDGGRGIWQLHSYRPLWALATRGALGLAESYLSGDWDSPDLTALLTLAARNERDLGSAAAGSAWLTLPDRLWHRLHANSRRQAARNIAFHYDLGNDFYAQWLDPSMTYSAALFDGADEPLESAQLRKYARLADLAGVSAGDRVLEIGCGWGGFLEYAAGTRGADVTGVSISPAQCGYARERLAAAGLATRARVEQCDYRDLGGRYPRIVSIEMFEAVGEAYWDTYARQLAARLAPGGAAALQLITIAEDRFENYRRNPDFIQRYVFPGGMLPSDSALAATLARAGLRITARHTCALDYARTLACWRERFDANWPAIGTLGFDARFRRLWHFYLAYCEAGFRTGATDVVQIRVEHAR